MRISFYVAVAATVFIRSSVGEVFTIAYAADLLSKTPPNFAANFTIRNDPQKRFLRATGSKAGDLLAIDEARGKYASLREIIARLDEKHVANILSDMKAIRVKTALNTARKRGEITREDYDAAITLVYMIRKRRAERLRNQVANR